MILRKKRPPESASTAEFFAKHLDIGTQARFLQPSMRHSDRRRTNGGRTPSTDTANGGTTPSDQSTTDETSEESQPSSEPTDDHQHSGSEDDTQSIAARAVEALAISSSPTDSDRSNSSEVLEEASTASQSPGRTAVPGSRTILGRAYSLKIVSQPVQCTISGSGLCEPPLIAQLTIRNADEENAQNSLVEEDLPYLIANVSLWDASGRNQIFPQHGSPRQPAMRGDFVASGQIYYGTDGQEHIFFVFRRLQILQPGPWTLAISLIAIRPAGDVDQPESGTVLVGVKSSAVTMAVLEDSPLAHSSVQIERNTRELLELLREQGADLSGSELDSIESRD